MVPREARGGGLVLFWRDTMAVTVEGFDKYHIDVIFNKNTNLAWRFTGFYGEPEMSHPKPDTRICDHDRHANIKPKPDINKNHLNF